MTRPNTLSSVSNALRLLRFFSVDRPELGISELARMTGLGKSTVHRLVSTMTREGFLVKDNDTQRYRLGVSLLSFAGIITSHMEIHREAGPIVKTLVERTGETAHISVLEQTDVVYLLIHECKHPVRLLSHLGGRNPSYCTGSGKALLAFQPEEVIERVISQGLKKYTRHTVTDPEKLRKQLEEIRQQGYAVSPEELHEGVTSIGAPIRDYTGRVIAAVNIAGPIQRIQYRLIPKYVKEVTAAAQKISEAMGYIPMGNKI